MDSNTTTQSWTAGDLELDVGLQRVLQAGAPVELPKLSFDLLLALLRAAPRFVSNEELMTQVWRDLVVSPETVTQRVKLLRDALGDDPKQPRYIQGLRGRGYRLIPPVSAGAARIDVLAVTTRPGRWWTVVGALVALMLGAAFMLRPESVKPGRDAVPTVAACAHSQNAQARLACSRGRTLLGHTTIAGSIEAEHEFSRARDLDPTFVAAIAGLYDARLQAANLRRAGAQEALAANEPLLTEIERLQPDSGAVQLARAMWGTGTPDERARLFEEGLKLDPTHAAAITAYSQLLDGKLHRPEEGARWLDRALSIDPLLPQARFRAAQRQFDRVGAGIDQLNQKLLDSLPDYYPAQQRFAKYRWQGHGEIADAIDVMERAIKADPENPWGRHTAVAFYLDANDPAAAESLAQDNAVVQASTAALRALYNGDIRKAGEAALQPGSFIFNEFERFGVTIALRDYALQTGQYERVMKLLSDRYQLPLEGDWKLDVTNFREGELLASLLLAQGHTQAGLKRLDEVIAWIDMNAFMGPVYNLRTKALALALKGKNEAALSLLKESFRQNDYTMWWYTLKYDKTWEKLRTDPAFVAVQTEVLAHIASERAHLAELKRAGEVPDRDAGASPRLTRANP
jgi:DNA-binding winged helix-turn-helix (wHTH) protein/tetratricopeptide (TPR) repeat protein